MQRKTLAAAAASLVAVGALAVAGASLANAETTPTPSATASSGTGSAESGDSGTKGDRHGGGQHTPVTGDEADKVIAAVEAKDSAATITSVRKDADGSYDALGTKDGNPVKYDVSTDLETITEHTGGGPGGRGDHGGRGESGGTTSTSPSEANGTPTT